MLFFLIIGINLKNWVGGFNSYDKRILIWLLFWHVVAGIGYVIYITSSGGGDAFNYWDTPKKEGWNAVINSITAGSASGYMFLLNYFPSKVMDLSFFTGSMMYVLFGYFGFILLYKIIKENIAYFRFLKNFRILKIPIFPFFLFLPNIHFWTSNIGKDTIIFLCITAFIYSLNKFKERIMFALISSLVIFFIRPHILLFLMFSYGLAIVLNYKIKIYKKVFIYIISLAAFFVLLPRVMDFAKLDNIDATSVESYANHKASALANKIGTGSAIDITNYPYIFKVFTFLFRPLFFDLLTPLGLAASIENLIFLIFFIYILRSRFISSFFKSSTTLKTIIIFFIIGSLTFPLILGNLGIILREKTPFVIMLIIFGYSVTSQKIKIRLENSTLHK